MESTNDSMKFSSDMLSGEEAFWTMFYFLKHHYDLSGGTFDVSDILSASEPVGSIGHSGAQPADSGMISFWNEAIEEYREKGMPPLKGLATKTQLPYRTDRS